MDLLLCLNDSISDFVSRTESNEIVGLVGSECMDWDAKDFEDFIFKPRSDQSDGFRLRVQCFFSTRVGQNKHILHNATVGLDVTCKFSKCPPKSDDIIHKHILGARLHTA